MSKAPNKDECVQVMVRCRPISQKELQNGSKCCIEIDKSVNQVIMSAVAEQGNKGEAERAFTFDAVYDQDSTQRSVYDEGAFPLVESVMFGYNGTIFAYGQTGCGKTHTMIGLKGDKSQKGIIPNAFDHIFGYFDDSNNNNKKFLIRCSYLEIYNEQIRDLLSQNIDKKLDLKENPDKGVYVKDLTTRIVKSIPEIEQYMESGTLNRKTGETAMNKDSSRSHSIFTIYVETAENDSQGNHIIKAGKLNLVDLAGSERQSKTQATGARLKEATQINLSLSALGNVISALVEGKHNHVPYRDSKLTRLLQDSLGGNTRTIMIAAISPADYNFDETLTTLRYASRAKSIKNKPRVNMDPKDALLKQYEEEIQKLRQIIEMSKQGQHISAQDLGESIKMLNRDQNILMGGKSSHKDESVEELLQKLAKKGKKVKLLEESISTKEQKIKNKDQNLDEVEDLERDSIEDEDEIEQEVQSTKNSKNRNEPSNFKQKSNKAKQTKDYDIDQEDIQIEGEENNIQAHQLLEKQKHQLKIIEQTNQQLQEEAKKREELQMILKQMEERLVSGGNALQEKEREQYQAQRKLQLELEKEKQIQQQLLQEREQQEAEFLEKEKHYNSMQEEVQDGRKIIKKLRQKLKNAQNELKDIHKENLEKNEELLDTVREQAKELDFLNQLTGFLVTDEQMYQIKEKTEWDDERRKWRLPPFIIKQKEVQFPKLGNNTKAYLQEELDNNEIQFQNLNQSSLFSDSQMNGGGSLNGQVNQRRTNGFGHRGGNNNQNNIQRGANDQSQNFIGNKGIPNGNNNTYISSKDLRNDNLSSRANQELIKMTRNESKNSQGFAIGNQQKRNNLRMNNENYLESPEVSQKKQNNKAGVQLAPLGTQHHQIGNGRSSLMSIKGLEENEGSESHPILRVQNYKKPLLDKQILPNGGIPQYNMEFFDEKQSQIDLNNILNSKKKGSRKRENAQLAPLNHAPHKLLVGSHSQMSNNPI